MPIHDFQMSHGRMDPGKRGTREIRTHFHLGLFYLKADSAFHGEKTTSGLLTFSHLPPSSPTPYGESAVYSQARDSITFIVRLGYDCL